MIYWTKVTALISGSIGKALSVSGLDFKVVTRAGFRQDNE